MSSYISFIYKVLSVDLKPCPKKSRASLFYFFFRRIVSDYIALFDVNSFLERDNFFWKRILLMRPYLADERPLLFPAPTRFVTDKVPE